MPTQGKRPLGYRWEKYPFTPQSLREQLARTGKVKIRNCSCSLYEAQPTGIGLLCGQNSKEFLISVDCDGPSAYDQIKAMAHSARPFGAIAQETLAEPIALEPLPPTVAFTSGRPGRAQYLFKILEPPQHQWLKSRKIATAPGEALELRGSNLQSVLPPSVHPLTGYYRWLPGCRPDEIQVAAAPLWVVQKMATLPKHQTISTASEYLRKDKPQEDTPTNADIQKALLLLEVIHPRFADNYDSWIKVGMALHTVSPSLLPAWDRWSQLSPKYKRGECQYKWDSFKKWGITVRTLYRLANLS
ncbi:PriCT-2 domain-containing protein [Scytonema sp. PCC 10023]|uniref:PriCT-2 domain-containing protein n=1 Tax=Scytonema sp. PCC 10023 TaxID=1680591 RepID=UPI0039C7090F